MSWAYYFAASSAHPSWLCLESIKTYGLIMSETKDWHVLVLQSKCLKVLDNLGNLGQDKIQSTLDEDEVGIVGDCIYC